MEQQFSSNTVLVLDLSKLNMEMFLEPIDANLGDIDVAETIQTALNEREVEKKDKPKKETNQKATVKS